MRWIHGPVISFHLSQCSRWVKYDDSLLGLRDRKLIFWYPNGWLWRLFFITGNFLNYFHEVLARSIPIPLLYICPKTSTGRCFKVQIVYLTFVCRRFSPLTFDNRMTDKPKPQILSTYNLGCRAKKKCTSFTCSWNRLMEWSLMEMDAWSFTKVESAKNHKKKQTNP